MRGARPIALIVAALVLFLIVVCPFVIPVPALGETVPPEELADPDSLFAEVNGLRVHYKEAGQGEPAIVLLHGFGASVYSWRETMAPLGDVGTVIAFDRPGFGLTSRPLPGEWGGENPYTPEAQADLTVALMEKLGVERAVLMGHSAGGTIALLTALRHPERVQALVLVDAAVYGQTGTPDWLRPLLLFPPMRRWGPFLARFLVRSAEAVIRTAWSDPDKITMELLSGYKKPLQAQNWDRALWELILASHPLGLEAQLDQVMVPTLVITGGDDRIVPADNSERLASELPDAELVVIPDCGHVPQEECPGTFLRAVTAFLEELPEE
jgi:pimeloyl-ACP methyl ester carboxylesterase